MIQKKYLVIAFALMAMLSCDGVDEVVNVNDGDQNAGYRPVYGSPEMLTISMTNPRSVKNPGKIYVYGKYLLINEVKEGIHVYDNANPQAPASIGFITMVGNTDMAVKDNVLYGDHMGNLVALTISDFNSITEMGRLDLASWNLGVPPPAGEYFECVDPAKGLVIGWEKSDAKNLKCYAIR